MTLLGLFISAAGLAFGVPLLWLYRRTGKAVGVAAHLLSWPVLNHAVDVLSPWFIQNLVTGLSLVGLPVLLLLGWFAWAELEKLPPVRGRLRRPRAQPKSHGQATLGGAYGVFLPWTDGLHRPGPLATSALLLFLMLVCTGKVLLYEARPGLAPDRDI